MPTAPDDSSNPNYIKNAKPEKQQKKLDKLHASVQSGTF